MSRQLSSQETARADVVIRPDMRGIGSTAFDQKNQAILAGEKALMKAMPEIRRKLVALAQARGDAAASTP